MNKNVLMSVDEAIAFAKTMAILDDGSPEQSDGDWDAAKSCIMSKLVKSCPTCVEDKNFLSIADDMLNADSASVVLNAMSPKFQKKNKDIVMKLVLRYPYSWLMRDAFEANKALRDDEDFIRKLCAENGEALLYANDAIQSNREIALIAVRDGELQLSKAKGVFWDDDEFVSAAAKGDISDFREIISYELRLEEALKTANKASTSLKIAQALLNEITKLDKEDSDSILGDTAYELDDIFYGDEEDREYPALWYYPEKPYEVGDAFAEFIESMHNDEETQDTLKSFEENSDGFSAEESLCLAMKLIASINVNLGQDAENIFKNIPRE